jgi:UDPglucose--hexose-1-phosphate uridylyltransferase
VWIAPRQHGAEYTRLSEQDARDLAELLVAVAGAVAVATDGAPTSLALCATPNLAALPMAPEAWRHLGSLAWHWWIELVPRLDLPGGFEWGSGMHINPTPPEDVASHLRLVEAALSSGETERSA